jgi:hypothetical protein
MANVPSANEGFALMPEIVCSAIPESSAMPKSLHEDLRTLTTIQLIDLVQSRNGTLSKVEVPTIMSIAQERLSASKADADLADQLLQVCRKLGDGP